ncbi:Type II/IV secretion system secretin RcpA/CpaC, associated with Flp pilus assembly [Rhodovulum sp. PH10]|uniref:type II and III secretion system protein family protein n=1 Tax=Rhodovulum sp. PH10 TaxID=1187851 RepID=UPI00027C1E67|nr:type II and III secretion system protein family protein [Rhodovulum sp. PH10]EJW10950.1 Type II/IV secretion system secretin RcpA/CpaC, associated with Flp pilus assembly [Rhodovulum sp. PH10]
MSIETLIRAAALGLLLAGAAIASADRSAAADRFGVPPATALDALSSEGMLRPVQLGVGKSIVVDLPDAVKDVLVADPSIANAVIRSAHRAYLIGAKIGQTNIRFFDAEGRQLAGYDIAVTRDLTGLRLALKRILPQRDIHVEGLGQTSVILSGTVANTAESQRAYDIAVRYLSTPAAVGAAAAVASAGGSDAAAAAGSNGNSNVVNALTIGERDQVLLKVTVAEVQRNIVKQLGIDLSGTVGSGNAVLNFNTNNPFSAYGETLTDTAIAGTFGGKVTATLRAMERAGVIRTLAEPNLSAVSGEGANFLVGGEFPIFSGNSCNGTVCTPTITFKKFGVSLNFTPVVLSAGRISLRVQTEVSELTQDGAITTDGVTVPALKVRRVDSTVEIPSGGALAMAGMIQDQTKQAINGLPGLLQVPVLGTLFRSRDYVSNQTELMILVTPYIVRPTSPKELSRPDDGFADISDPSAILLGRLNRIYGTPGVAEPQRAYFGQYGFILD